MGPRLRLLVLCLTDMLGRLGTTGKEKEYAYTYYGVPSTARWVWGLGVRIGVRLGSRFSTRIRGGGLCS